MTLKNDYRQNMGKIKPVFKWMGGKTRAVNLLLQYIPRHDIYVEVFGGAASLLLAKRSAVKLDVYNDLDDGLVNFFRVLRDDDKRRRLINLIELTPYARAEYDHCRATWQMVTDDVEKARRWFVVAKMSYGGMFGSAWGYSFDSRDVQAWLRSVDGMEAVAARFRQVQIENSDGIEIIQKYDGDRVLFYCDPPYISGASADYRINIDAEYHRRLVDTLLDIRGMCLLHGYPTEVYRPLEQAGWHVTDKLLTVWCGGNSKNRKDGYPVKTERLWINPVLQAALQNQKGFGLLK